MFVPIRKYTRENAKELILSLWFLSMWYFIYFDGLQWTVQFALFNRLVTPTNMPVALLLLFSLIIIITKGGLNNNHVGITALILFLYLFIVNLLFVALNGNPDLSSHLLIANLVVVPAYYLLISVLLLSRWRISESVARKTIIFMGLIAILVACRQQLYGYSSEELKVLTTAHATNFNFYGSIRPASIFLIPGEYSIFVAFLFVFTLSYLMSHRQTLVTKSLLLIVLCGLVPAEYFAFARNGILLMILATVFTLLLHYKKPSKFMVWTPYVTFCLGLMVYGFAPFLSSLMHSDLGKVISDASMIMRYKELATYFGMIYNAGIIHVLFGMGLKQFAYLNNGVYIDNTYLYVLLQGGVIGLLLWVAFMWRLWMFLYYHTAKAPSPLRVALLSVVATWPAVAFFISSLQYLIFIFLALVILNQQPVGSQIYRKFSLVQ